MSKGRGQVSWGGGEGRATGLRTKESEWAASSDPGARTAPRRGRNLQPRFPWLEQASLRGPVNHLGARNDAEVMICRAMPWQSKI